MRRPYSWLLSAFLALVGVSGVHAQPKWVKQPPASSSLYLQGVGIAKSTGDRGRDRQRADDLARVEIARQIRVTVTARLTSVTREQGDVRPRLTRDTEQVVESSVSFTLDGVAVKARYYDKKTGTYYALAVLDRRRAAERVGERIRAAAERAALLRLRADAYRNEGKTYRALLALLRAAEERGAVVLEEDIYHALAAQAHSADALLEAKGSVVAPFSPTSTDIDGAIGAMVSALSLDVVNGDGQRIDRGRTADSLIVRLTLRTGNVVGPAAGFPIRFRVAQGRGRLDEHVAANERGEAATTLYQAGTCGTAACLIVASIDTAAIRMQASGAPATRWLERLAGIITRFTLRPGAFGLRDGIAELACRLTRSLPSSTSLVVDRFTYRDTRLAGPFTRPLRRMLKAEFAGMGRRLIERAELSPAAADYGDPNAAETTARIARADAVLWGDYRERGDRVIVNARVTGSDGRRLATAEVGIPSTAIPFVLRPPVLDVDLPEPPLDGLPLKLWTERGDGGLYIEDERLIVHLQAGTACHLRLLYRQADGRIIRIFPNALGGEDRAEPGSVYTFPGSDAPYDFVIRPPFGVEYLIAVARPDPFPETVGRQVRGGVLLRGTVKEVIQRLTGGSRRVRYGQAVTRLTTVGQ